MRFVKLEEMSKNMNPDMDKEVAEGLSWMGGTFITEYDKHDTPNTHSSSSMNIEEFLNG